MDKDGDGKLTSAEYERGIRTAIERDFDGFIDSLFNSAGAWYDLFHPVHDGSLNLEEYTMLAQGMGVIAPADIKMAFCRLDHDADGNLRHEEFRRAIIEFWTSEDPEADGNWLYGPL